METYHPNKRLQTDMVELGNSGNASADSCRVYNFYPVSNPASCAPPTSGSTGNNGNVTGYYYVDSVNPGLNHTATYGYDSVNRLLSAGATGNSTYSQSFVGYDAWGNLTCSPAGPGCLPLTYNTATNHLAGYTYDAAGNVTNDTTNSYQWDAEAHLTKVINGQSVAISTNTYNALGQRVRDVTTSSTTDEAYGAGGSLLWRYTGNSSDPNQRAFVPFSGGILAEYYGGSPGGTIFDHPDEIGSATTSSDYTGNTLNEKLFYPFGELWTGAAIPNLGMHQTFAQLPDYDPETDEYNTANRHYTPSGRWMTPDPGGLKVVNLFDPQSWNMYAYVRNNPTTLTDPTGLAGNCSFQRWSQGACGGVPGLGLWNIWGSDGFITYTMDFTTPPPGFVPISPVDERDCPGCYVFLGQGKSGGMTDAIWQASIQQIVIHIDNHDNLSNVKAPPTGPSVQAQPTKPQDQALTPAEIAACGFNPDLFRDKSSANSNSSNPDSPNHVEKRADTYYGPGESKTQGETKPIGQMGNPELAGPYSGLFYGFEFMNNAAICKDQKTN